MPTQLNPYILGSGLFENSSSKMHYHKKVIIPKALTWPLHFWVVPIRHDHKCKTETILFMEMISNAWYSIEGTPMVLHGIGYGWLYGIK